MALRTRNISISPSFAFLRLRRTWSFPVLVLYRMAKKSTKIYTARAQLLFYCFFFRRGLLKFPYIITISLLLFYDLIATSPP